MMNIISSSRSWPGSEINTTWTGAWARSVADAVDPETANGVYGDNSGQLSHLGTQQYSLRLYTTSVMVF
jgi:hypothetical protein